MDVPEFADRQPEEVTRLLVAAGEGIAGASEALLAAVYADLRHLARAKVSKERNGTTLQATALVHEAWMRLQQSTTAFLDRRHYFGAASRIMRQLLIERHRRRHRLKRGGGAEPMDDFEALQIEAAPELERIDLLALDEALTALEQQDERMAQIVQMKFFAGLSVEEIASVLEVSPRTIKREWAVARAWLYQHMQ